MDLAVDEPIAGALAVRIALGLGGDAPVSDEAGQNDPSIVEAVREWLASAEVAIGDHADHGYDDEH